jgi:hypothetical protein
MNWLHFFLWVGGIYLLYYLALILFDVAGGSRAAATGTLIHELTFDENVVPAQMAGLSVNTAETTIKTRLDEAARERKQEPEMIGSGGVVIDNLFKLCKQEAIIYTRSVSF